MVLTLGSFILNWRATTAADLDLEYLSNYSSFSCNVRISLRFLGALPASLVASHRSPVWLFKVFGITLNVMNNT